MKKCVLLFPLLAICFFTFIIYTSAKPEEVIQSKPFTFSVDEITADGANFYTLDDNLNWICKYSDSGEFQYAISFSSFGTSHLFINEDGYLCRYDIKQDRAYVYGDSGELIETVALTYDEFSSISPSAPIKKLTVDGKNYKYRGSLVFNSEVEIVSNDTKTVVVVESFWEHYIRNVVIVALLTGFICCIYELACFVMKETHFGPRQRFKRGRARDAKELPIDRAEGGTEE